MSVQDVIDAALGVVDQLGLTGFILAGMVISLAGLLAARFFGRD